MKKLLIVLSSLMIISCSDDDLLQNDVLVEGPKVVGFQSGFGSISYFEDLGVQDASFAIDVLANGNGRVTTTDLVVTYEVDLVNSTAVEGVEFDFADPSRKVTIKAGTRNTTVDLKVNTDSFNPVAKTALILKIVSVTGANISNNLGSIEINFVGCNSLLGSATGGPYNVTHTSATGAVRSYTGEFITLLEPNTFRTNSTGTFAPTTPAGSTGRGYDFVDICGEITIPNQQLFRFYSNTVDGTDAYDGLDGIVTSPTSFTTKYVVSSQTSFTSVYTR